MRPNTRPLLPVLLGVGVSMASAAVPTYRVDAIAPVTTTTSLYGASQAGHVVGYRVQVGMILPFVARLGEGMTMLPLPAGYQTGVAMDVNSAGVVVGTASTGTFPLDGGEPAIWTPDGAGGYTVSIPQQFTTLPNPLRPGTTIPAQGGQIVAINEAGVMVGWTRYFGFSGGPTTRFFTAGAPVDLKALGFQATAEDINDENVVVGNELLMDLDTGLVTDIGVPTAGPVVPCVGFWSAAINNDNQVVGGAQRSTSQPDRWATYFHEPVAGYQQLNPAVLLSPFIGFYDNNNLGDISAAGGVLFRAEGVLSNGYDGLLDPAFAHWDTGIGFIDDQRRVITTAIDTTTGQSAIVQLTPLAACAADLNGDGVADFGDVSAFVAAFNASDQAADLNADGVLDFGDVSAFAAAFQAGC
jgi:hypothetical protein